MTFDARSMVIGMLGGAAGLACASIPIPNRQFQDVTGIPIEGADMSFCQGLAGKDGDDCKPSVGGAPWVEARNIAPYVDTEPAPPPGSAENGPSARGIARRVFRYYVGHLYAGADIQPGCPNLDPFAESNQAMQRNTTVEYASFSVASIYAKKAVEKARATLEAEAKAQGLQISGEAMGKFEIELRKTIASSSNTSTDVVFVQAYWVGGLMSMSGHQPYRECFKLVRPAEDSIITGVAGLYYANFQKRAAYFESSWMSTAIDASIKGTYAADPLKLQAVSAKASAAWKNTIEETLKIDMQGRDFSSGFRPLYLRFERPASSYPSTSAEPNVTPSSGPQVAQSTNGAQPTPAGTSTSTSTEKPGVSNGISPPAPGPMPAGGEWSGVFYSIDFGYIHLVREGNRVTGKWLTPQRDRWGELEGTVNENILTFTWKEHSKKGTAWAKIASGRGYFKYLHPADDADNKQDDMLDGAFLNTADGKSVSYDAIKQRGVKPDLALIPGGADTEDDDWDKP